MRTEGWEDAEAVEDLADSDEDAGGRLFDLFQSASSGPDHLRCHVQGMKSHERTRKHKRARNVTFEMNPGCYPRDKRRNFTATETRLLDLAIKRGWSTAEGEEVLSFLRSPSFNASDIRCTSFRNLLLRLEEDQDAETEFRCINLVAPLGSEECIFRVTFTYRCR